jgi:hypothetical protein
LARKKLNGRLIAILIIVGIATVAVGTYLYVTSQSQVDEMSVLVFSDPMTENILNSLESENYTAFLRDMDPTMKGAYIKSEFTKLHDLLHEKVGHYGTKIFLKAERSGDFIVAYYNAVYSKEPTGVTVKVVFSVNTGGPTFVSGLWFSSPQLAS